MLPALHKIIRTALIIFPIFVFGWLGYKEIAPSGKVAVVYDMQREMPFISKLYPKDRVSESYQDVDGDFYRTFLSEPVYFDLKPSGQFEKVAVTVKYKNGGAAPVKMGGLINKTAWAFDWRDLPPTGGKWQNRTEFFDFSELIPEGNKYRLGFSASEMQADQVAIGEVKALFVRPELNGKGTANKLLEGFVWRMNKIF
jgi:hypothetical protein